MHLLELNLDVLLRIFAFLDVASVLKSSVVCSSFRRLSQAKYVWMAIVGRLHDSYGIGRRQSQPLAQYSVSELIALIKGMVLGPRAWIAGSTTPKIRRQVRLEMSPNTRHFYPTLLAGDNYLLFGRERRFVEGSEIWDLAHERKIWANGDIPCKDVAARTLLDQKIAIAVLRGQDRSLYPDPWEEEEEPPRLTASVVLRITIYDVGSQSESVVLERQLPGNFPALSAPIMDDELWVADTEWYLEGLGWIHGVLLVNWREGTFVLVRCGIQRVKHIVHGGLLRLSYAREDSQILLYPNSTFAESWQPLTTETLAAASRKPLIVEPIVLQTGRYPILRLPNWPNGPSPTLTVHRCPLHTSENCYIVSTYINTCYPISSPSNPSLYRYCLRFPSATLSGDRRTNIPTWELLSSAGPISSTSIYAFTYAGYGLSHQQQYGPHTLCCLRAKQGVHGAEEDEEGPRTVSLPTEVSEGLKYGKVALSPYSSTLTVCCDNGVDIYYYD